LDLPHRICADIDKVKRAAELWQDDLSQKYYLAQLRWRLWLDAPSVDLMDSYSRPGALYSPKIISPEDVIVDCGAFDGDTLRAIVDQGVSFSRIIAIEPDPANCEKLRSYVSSLPEQIRKKVSILPFAAGSHRETLRFASGGSMQSTISADGDIDVESAPLDEIAYEYAPTYIKMDIEGAEPHALQGARHILADFTPKLAISIYHRFDHLWTIPLQIKQLTREYSCSLYPAAKAGWDFMCLAAPRSRSS
jgi:FkbM family methyltransferase